MTVAEYDPAGRPAMRRDPSGRVRRISYDASGRPSAIRAGDGPEIILERDALGRPVEVREPGSVRRRLRWDRAGRLIEQDRDGLVLRRRYGPDGERTALGYPDGTECVYGHDDGGLITSVRHPAIGEIRLSRDAAGHTVAADGTGLRGRWWYTDGLLTGYEYAAGAGRRDAHLARDAAGRVVMPMVDGAESRTNAKSAGGNVSVRVNRRSGVATVHGRTIR